MRTAAYALAATAVLCSAAGRCGEADSRSATIATIAGSGQSGKFPPGGGSALQVAIDQPFGVEFGPDGSLYIAAVGQHRVLRLDLQGGRLGSVAGDGRAGYAGDGGPATSATLNEPYEVRFDRQGNLYFVEMQNHLVRRVDRGTGVISTVAGDGQPGFSGDGGPASEARFRNPHSIALDERGAIYVADIGNHRIRRIDPLEKTIKTIAGNGEPKLPADGAKAAGSPIFGPRALSITRRTMWIALREGNSVWRMELEAGTLHRVAGTGETGYAGDGGAALQATFNGPKGIVAARVGLVYVVDTENQAIREIDPENGTIRTVAGGGPETRGFGGDGGPASKGRFDRPHGIGLAPDGSLVIGDTNNHRVRLVQFGAD